MTQEREGGLCRGPVDPTHSGDSYCSCRPVFMYAPLN